MIELGGYIRDIFQKTPGSTAVAHGWVKTKRTGKGVTFLQLSDGSTFKDLQIVVDGGGVPEATLSAATTGACLRVAGVVVASPGAGQAVELQAESITVIGTAYPATYPLQKKGHSM